MKRSARSSGRPPRLPPQPHTPNCRPARHSRAAAPARWDAVSAELQHAHATLQAQLQAGDEQRLQRWSDALQHVSTELAERLQANGERPAAQQQQVCDALAATAQQIGENGRAQASATLAEVSTLLQTAAAAPKAAADVINELRSTLSESPVRDNAMLEERGRLLATVQTLLDAVNHASHEQRTAVDALVGGSAELLERVGNRFTDHIAAETGKLDGIAAALHGSAGEVGQLASTFSEAVAQFGSAATALSGRPNRLAAHWTPRWPAAMSSWRTTWHRRARWSTSACCRRSK